MRVVLNIEADGKYPSRIWVICCRNIETGENHVFIPDRAGDQERFIRLSEVVTTWIGHNILGYDLIHIQRLLGIVLPDIYTHSIDTLIISKMADYSRKGHKLEDYAEELGVTPEPQVDYSKFSDELVTYCERKVDLHLKLYLKYLRYINSFSKAIALEHKFMKVINSLEANGFSFNKPKAEKLLLKVAEDLKVYDEAILKEFPPKTVLIREFTPKLTKFGTINRTSVPRVLHEKIHEYEAGVTYRHTKEVPFNPDSHKQIVDVLIEAGWSPEDKTDTHKEVEKILNRLKRDRKKHNELDIEAYSVRMEELKKYGWKINETNLDTLPPSAPPPARSLAKRILLESRRRSLTEWLGLVQEDGRIHGRFYGIGAWTHRMAHQQPNTANIPNEFDTAGKPKLLGKELRQLWQAPRNRLLVGVDAEGIQLRIFAHYINDAEFTDALVRGRKDDKTDPHSLNQRILGDVCKSRAAAKRFIYALLLGAGLGKLTEILGCSKSQAEEALDNLLQRYTGFAKLKQEVIPTDARRGHFIGLDGRPVRIPGETEGARRHLAMSGYLQNGEAIVMKMATLRWWDVLEQEFPDLLWMLVDLVHDEWQSEVPNDVTQAIRFAQIQCDALPWVGEQLGLKCPLAGSFYNDDHHENTIGVNWYQTH